MLLLLALIVQRLPSAVPEPGSTLSVTDKPCAGPPPAGWSGANTS